MDPLTIEATEKILKWPRLLPTPRIACRWMLAAGMASAVSPRFCLKESGLTIRSRQPAYLFNDSNQLCP